MMLPSAQCKHANIITYAIVYFAWTLYNSEYMNIVNIQFVLTITDVYIFAIYRMIFISLQ